MKKWILIAARAIVAMAALWLALRKVNWQEVNQFDMGVSLVWLLPALLFYNGSQFISAYRLLQFYKIHQPDISYPFNLRLYYKGMFYNLFLPGGIGGDAYKIIALKNSSNTYKQLATATLLDRTTGLVVLLLIITVLSCMVSLQGSFGNFFLLLPIFMALGIPFYYLVIAYYFKSFKKVLPVAGLLSLPAQGFQLISFYCILLALQVGPGFFSEYAFLFFVSSVVAALPLSIGGIGTRELAMAAGATYFHFSATKMVSSSLLFFMLVVISSVVGWAAIPGGSRKR